MTFQKVVCFIALAAAVIVFIYSLGIMTDLYDSLYATIRDYNNPESTYVPGSIVYVNMQGFNRQFLKMAIIMILSACLLFVTNTHVRRRYYIANYVSTGIYCCLAAGVSVWAHGQIGIYKEQFLQVDFAKLEQFAKMMKKTYSDSTFWFDVQYFVFAVVIISVVLAVINLIWKITMMKEEKSLIGAGKEAAAK